MKQHHSTFEAIGTQWVIESEGGKLSPEINSEIQHEIERFDRLYSRFRADSLVSKMAQQSGTYQIPKEDISLFLLYKQLYDITQGTFTPLIGQMLSEAGYDASYSLKSGTLNSLPTWDESIDIQKEEIHIKQPVLLELGGVGKGFLIDKIGQIMRSGGINNFCIDAGGDILQYSKDNQSIRVGLEHPENSKQVIGVATITNQSICASSGNRRKWGEFHHIMNPHTKKPQTDVLATWAFAETATLADAMATCLFFIQPTELRKHFSFDYVVVYPDYSVAKSSEVPVEFYYKK